MPPVGLAVASRLAARLTLADCVILNNQSGDGGAGGNAVGPPGPSGAKGADGGGAQGGTGGAGGAGGGVYAHNVTLTITNCQIIDNATGDGGTGGAATGGTGGDSGAGNGTSAQGGNGGYAIAGPGGAGGDGGGVYLDRNFGGSGGLIIKSSVIDSNHTGSGGSSNSAVGGNGGSGQADAAGGGQSGTINSTGLFSPPVGGVGGRGGDGGGIRSSLPVSVEDSDVSDNVAGNGHAGAQAQGAKGGDALDISGFPGGYIVFGGAGGAGGAGGGIFTSATLTLTQTALTGNRAGSAGAAGSALPGVNGSGNGPALSGTIGGAGGAGGAGGGLEAIGSAARSLSDVTVDSDAAGSGGNGGAGVGPTSADSGGAGGAGGAGGGIDNAGGAISVARSTISANTLGGAGAGGVGTGRNGANGAVGTGGAVNVGPSSSASATIFAANATPQCAGGIADGGNDIVSPAATGCPGTVTDPLLGPLAGNGGISPTRAIPASSPAVNAYACTGLDQRGATRPAGSACDIGAYEVAPPLASGESVDRGDTQVVVHATIIPNVNARVSFTYGTTSTGGSTTPVQTITGSGSQQVSATITGLQRDTAYHFHVTAANNDGTTSGADQTFTTLGKPPAGGNPTALKITNLSVTPATFADAAPHAKHRHTPLGTTITYTLSARATVTLTFERRSIGTRSNGRCVATGHTPRRTSRCTRYIRTATLTHASNRGTTSLPFSGLINKHALPTGTYHLAVTAVAGREHSRAVTVTLTIVKR